MKFTLKLFSPKLISLVVCAAISQFSFGHEEHDKGKAPEEMVITGIRIEKPLVLETNSKTPLAIARLGWCFNPCTNYISRASHWC